MLSTQSETPLSAALVQMLDEYFKAVEGTRPTAVYSLVMEAAERPLIEYILQRCEGNQSAAAGILGINRNTLRKRMLKYKMLEEQD